MNKKTGNCILVAALFCSMIIINQSCTKDEVLETANSLTDSRDGQVYDLVTIGTQKWFGENLNYKTINSWFYDDNPVNGDVYGRLYTWNAARNACPAGWHLPSDNEWQLLVDYLGGEDVAGFKLKESGTTHWDNTQTEVTNESGFIALPGGFRYIDGYCASLGMFCYFWSSTQSGEDAAMAWGLNHGDGTMYRGDSGHGWTNGYSVRCIKDN